jgi:hypothetical protein
VPDHEADALNDPTPAVLQPSVAEAPAQEILDLAVERESTLLVAGEDRIAVENDLEDASAPRYQLRTYADRRFDRGRQTGGTGLVVSDDAVCDGDVRHGSLGRV